MLASPKRDPPRVPLDDGHSLLVSVSSRQRDVLTSDLVGVTTSERHDLACLTDTSCLAGKVDQPGARRIALPASLATARTLRAGSVDNGMTKLAGKAVSASLEFAAHDHPRCRFRCRA